MILFLNSYILTILFILSENGLSLPLSFFVLDWKLFRPVAMLNEIRKSGWRFCQLTVSETSDSSY